MNTDFLRAIEQVSAEKKITSEAILRAIEVALVTAYRRNFGTTYSRVDVRINRQDGAVRVFTKKLVVEDVTDPVAQISIGDALRTDSDANLSRMTEVEVTPTDFGRLASQTAKQVVLQRLREVERDQLHADFAGRVDEILSGQISRIETRKVNGIEGRHLIVTLDKAEGLVPPLEQVPTEVYQPNQRMRFYVTEVTKGQRGTQIILSRTHRNLVRRLFELEVPEIYNGIVEIRSIAREPGSRTKVAVQALQPGVDPVGSCVGVRGTRIQNVVAELHGEKIDVIQWDPDPAVFVANALSPAKVVLVELNDLEKTAVILVPDRQLSLAIGREGQNARLAAKLTSWRIDIKPASSRGLDSPETVIEQRTAVDAVTPSGR